jgi:radical SAM superfamily enzyme YgiQ (UPF0313 family)
MRKKTTKTLKNDYLEMNDYHTDITEKDITALLNQLRKLNPALIGIGLQSPHFEIAKRLTSSIKQRFDVPVIWGGAHPTINPHECIDHTDMLCVGEGFDPLLELSRRILQKKEYNDIKNLWINEGGTVIRNSERPLLKNLDALPFASYDNANKTYIDDGNVQTRKNIDYFGFGFSDAPMKTVHQTMTAFGCPMRCSFCMNALNHDKFRRRSVANVISELVEAKRSNPHLKKIFFWDNIFHVNKKWCLEFARKYKEEVNLPFFAYSHPQFIDEESFIALRKAGWCVTVMGIQSGSDTIRKEVYHRMESAAQILKAAHRLNGLKKVPGVRKIFRIYYDYVKNNPLENKQALKESLALILKLPKDFIFQAFNLSFFPNYKLTSAYLKRGFISEGDIEGKENTSANNWITTFNSKKEYRGFFKMQEYYYLLFSLAQFRLFPNFVIRRMEKKQLFAHNLRLLYRICRIVRFVDLYSRPLNYVYLWELVRAIPLRWKIKHRTLLRYS